MQVTCMLPKSSELPKQFSQDLSTRDLQAQLAAAKVEARQITDETRAMAVERHEIEQLIAEADFRPFAAGSTTAKGQDQDQLKSELLQIAHRASDNARTLQEAMAEVSSKASPPPASGAVPETSATAAFLNSDLGKGLPQSKLDISKGLFHSSGGLQHLANRGQGLDNSSTASTGSPASAAYPSRSTGDLDSIQTKEGSSSFDREAPRLEGASLRNGESASTRQWQRHDGFRFGSWLKGRLKVIHVVVFLIHLSALGVLLMRLQPYIGCMHVRTSACANISSHRKSIRTFV
eukprot:s1155_g10.t1